MARRAKPRPRRGPAAALALLALVLATPVGAEEVPAGVGVAEVKVELREARGGPGGGPDLEAAAVCSVSVVQGATAARLLCRHELGAEGEVTLVRQGDAAGLEAPLWSAPLASPFEATAALSKPVMDSLLAGELALRIESPSTGVVVEAAISALIFSDGFDIYSMCRWSNYPCPDDGNQCTAQTCTSTGVCQTTYLTSACDLPGASGGCFLGSCIILSCNDGFSNCDVTNTNGCEVSHNTRTPNGCSGTPTYVGWYPGDTVCGAICGSNLDSPHEFATPTGTGEAIFRAEAREHSTCIGGLEHRIDLEVPEGVDYDLYVYKDDCTLVDSSINDTGVSEVVLITANDNPVLSDDFFYRVEVRWFSGRSCEPWTLHFTGYECS